GSWLGSSGCILIPLGPSSPTASSKASPSSPNSDSTRRRPMAERARSRRATGRGRRNGAASSKGRRAGPSLTHGPANEVLERWLGKIRIAKNAYERAHETTKTRKSELANVYKAAEQDGCDTDGIKEFFKADKFDLDVLARRYATMGRVAQLEGSK